MKTMAWISTIALSLVFLAGPAVAEETYTQKKDKVGYTIGLNMGRDFARRELEIGLDAFVQGFKDGMAGSEPKISDEQRQETMMQLAAEMKAKQEAKIKLETEKNLKEGQEFMAANAKKDGVVVLESGLQYKVIQEGTGDNPKAEDTVTVNYKGTLVDGTVFDSTESRGKPATFAVNKVIQGWTEALQLMKVGSKWIIYLPSNLAYGPRGAGEVIGPEKTLVFEVELIAIEKSEKK